MLHRLRREASIIGPVVTVAVAISLLLFFLSTDHQERPFGKTGPADGVVDSQEPPPLSWEPTGEYRVTQSGVGLNVHAFSLKHGYMAVFYSVDHASLEPSVSPKDIVLADDTGRSYSILNHSTLGSALGVTAGLLVVEPYTGQGKALTLTVNDMAVASDVPPAAIAGTWSVTFVENRNPGQPADYELNTKIAPEVMPAGDITLGKAGGPEVSFVKLLIERAGEQAAIYGGVLNGVAQPLAEAEFRQVAPFDPPPPPFWPAPAAH